MKNFFYFIAKIIILSCLIGIFVSGFQFVSDKIINFSKYVVNNNTLFIIFIFIIFLIGIGLLFYNHKFKSYTGSGIPQFEAYYEGEYEIQPFKMLINITINSLLAFFSGFLLGGEGPSITIASSLGLITNKITKTKDNSLVAIGGSAGFACAFLSPLAGIMHLIEENKKILNLKFIIVGSIMIIIASTVSFFIFSHSLLPHLESEFLPFKYYYILLLVGVLGYFVGRLYVFCITKCKDLVGENRIWNLLLPLILVCFFVLKKYNLFLVGSGSDILHNNFVNIGIIYCLGLMIYRIIGTAISANQKISGGLVLPMLTVGYLLGYLIIAIFQKIDIEIVQYKNIIIVVAMLTVFAAVCITPLTAIALSFKIINFKVIIFPILISLIIMMILVKIFKSNSIYYELKERLVRKKEQEVEKDEESKCILSW